MENKASHDGLADRRLQVEVEVEVFFSENIAWWEWGAIFECLLALMLRL